MRAAHKHNYLSVYFPSSLIYSFERLLDGWVELINYATSILDCRMQLREVLFCSDDDFNHWLSLLWCVSFTLPRNFCSGWTDAFGFGRLFSFIIRFTYWRVFASLRINTRTRWQPALGSFLEPPFLNEAVPLFSTIEPSQNGLAYICVSLLWIFTSSRTQMLNQRGDCSCMFKAFAASK